MRQEFRVKSSEVTIVNISSFIFDDLCSKLTLVRLFCDHSEAGKTTAASPDEETGAEAASDKPPDTEAETEEGLPATPSDIGINTAIGETSVRKRICSTA